MLGTQAQVGNPPAPPASRTGVAWFVLKPEPGTVDMQGILADPTASFAYPALGVTPSGRGMLTFSVVSENYYPSVGYAPIDAKIGAGPWNLYEAGASPQDGFTEYTAFGTPPRARWGDYSMAAVDGDTVYTATEYIGMPSCSLTLVAPYNGAPPWYYPFPGTGAGAFTGFGSCLEGNPTPGARPHVAGELGHVDRQVQHEVDHCRNR